MLSSFAPTLETARVLCDQAPTHMIISPYTDAAHLLDLRTVDVQEQLLAHALAKLQSLRPDYATANYVATFNWDEVASDLRSQAAAIDLAWTARTFYIVVFR